MRVPGEQKHVVLLQKVVRFVFCDYPLAFAQVDQIVILQLAVKIQRLRGLFVEMRIGGDYLMRGGQVETDGHMIPSFLSML